MVQLEGFLGGLNNTAGNLQAVEGSYTTMVFQPLFSSINSLIWVYKWVVLQPFATVRESASCKIQGVLLLFDQCLRFEGSTIQDKVM